MKILQLFSIACFASLSWTASAETVVKILHIQSNQKVRDIWQAAADEYQKAHPGVKVQFNYLDNEAFKAKLPTLLQSNDRPSAFHSWGGGVMYEQIQAGVCQDITNAIAGEFKDSFYPAGIQNFMYQDKSYGLPNDVGPIIFWYNKELCEKAGVDPTKIKYWDDFLEAVKKCKSAGVTPIMMGGADEWPLHFYPVMLMMRIIGKDGMAAAYKGENGGFAGPEVVKAWTLYKELCDLDPFQRGFQAAKAEDAYGSFHDGKAAFELMGSWMLVEGRMRAADKKGLPDEKLGWFFFPEVKGGNGKASDIFASVDGWLVSHDAPKETVDFMKVWLGKDTQMQLAKQGLFIPMVKGTAEVIQEPFIRQIAEAARDTDWIQIAMDQLLGPDTGRLFNDEAAGVAGKSVSPEQAAKAIEDSFAKNRP
ncbi:MAG: extracellular solute-binding protein [Verrucomicrobia bacterium]|nr:extracellular solute-binding protein [Verrucomicrobiota bacterium]